MSENDYYHGVDVGIDIYMDRALKAEATAIRRKELLVEVRKLLDVIYSEDIVSSGDLGKIYEKIEKELADEESEGGISHAVGSES